MKPVPFSSAPQLGAAVRSAREARELTQVGLAAQAGVARQWLVRLEAGRLPNPTLQNIFRVLHVLDLELSVASRTRPDAPDLDVLLGGS